METEILDQLRQVLGAENVRINKEAEPATTNTFGLSRQIEGVLLPATVDQVRKLAKIANERGLKLYPISRGQNLGYGEMLPITDGQWIVDLHRMDAIRNFDPEQGTLVVEPGVTQQQLSEYLSPTSYTYDSTGAGLQASILGNTLEGGFGHTAKGNHRKAVMEIEVVLGNGEFLKTGTFPGPDLTGLFIQSNFGIVTAMKIELVKKPERLETFLALVDDSKLDEFISGIKKLLQKGTIASIVHVPNAMRALMTSSIVPEKYRDRLIDEKDALEILSSPLIKASGWTAIGSVYGTYAEVAAKKQAMKNALRDVSKIRFFSDAKFKTLKNLLQLPVLGGLDAVRRLQGNLKRLAVLHNLQKGIPSNEGFDNILWKLHSREDLGLMWLGPTIPAIPGEVRNFLNIVGPIYKKYSFEMPLTLNFVEPTRLVGILSITFNKNMPEEKERAHGAYRELLEAFRSNGIPLYRSSVMSMDKIDYDPQKKQALSDLKKIFDPKGIISPGRYNIS